MVRYLHPSSSSPTLQSNSIWTWKDTDWTAPQYCFKRKLGKQKGKKNLTGRVQCVLVCVCGVAVDKCKMTATPKDNPVFTFRYCRKQLHHSEVLPFKTLQSSTKLAKVFYYICSLPSPTDFSGKTGRKWQLERADEKWFFIKLISWRIPYLAIMTHGVISQQLPRKKKTQPAWGWQTQCRHCSRPELPSHSAWSLPLWFAILPHFD